MVESEKETQNIIKPANELITEYFQEIWFEIWYKPVLSVVSRWFFE